jgi:predicted O-methyltransferase YrrM
MTESSEIWTGKASSYDRVRPEPPPVLLDLLTQVIHLPHPALVVDVGSGTGMSTAIWGERAERVIGIEPNADMRKEAVHKVEDHPYAARFLEMMQSNAFNNQFQFTDQEIGLDRLSLAALQHIGSEPIPWYVSYRVRIGIK